MMQLKPLIRKSCIVIQITQSVFGLGGSTIPTNTFYHTYTAITSTSGIHCSTRNGTYRNLHCNHCNSKNNSQLNGRNRRSSEIEAETKLITAEEEARRRRTGQAKARLEKSIRRENRISFLQQQLQKQDQGDDDIIITEDEKRELKGLLKLRENFEEQYNPESFNEEHLYFKTMHNDAFIALAKYCQEENVSNEDINVFYLDGPDGGTTSALIDRGGFDASQCYVANRHESSCCALRMSGGGRLPDNNVVHATAAEALSSNVGGGGAISNSIHDESLGTDANESIDGIFSDIPFAAYYFDGCGGFIPHVIGMMTSALVRDDDFVSTVSPVAIGYSLLGGSKDVVEKELKVSQALTIIAKRRKMRVVHVLDDPIRYCLPPDIKKIGGSYDGTFTSWYLLEPDDRL
jgi:hypothetical protein